MLEERAGRAAAQTCKHSGYNPESVMYDEDAVSASSSAERIIQRVGKQQLSACEHGRWRGSSGINTQGRMIADESVGRTGV